MLFSTTCNFYRDKNYNPTSPILLDTVPYIYYNYNNNYYTIFPYYNIEIGPGMRLVRTKHVYSDGIITPFTGSNVVAKVVKSAKNINNLMVQ